MEMHGFHSVNILNGAASDELELSSNSNSSSQSSPDDHSSTASPPIPCPPPPQAHEQSCNIPIHPAPAIPTARLTREQVLKSLNESKPHAIMLQNLQKSERGHQKDASWHKKAVRRLSKELYQVVSLYVLLQGALFTAVAQSSLFTCTDWWGPAGIVGAVTLGTICSALDKLRRMGHQKQEVKRFEKRQSAVYDKIELLYFKGSACNIEALEPAHTDAFNAEPNILCIFSAHGLLVLGFLVGFSALIMASCSRMLCPPCHCR